MTGWEGLNAAVAEARTLVCAQAPDAATAAEGEAYVARVLAAGLGGAVLGHQFRSHGLARALPVYGGPNPDYLMFHAPVDPAGRYRLEGRLNGSERVGVGLYTVGPNGAPLIAGYAAFEPGDCGADGGFGLEIAADAGPGGLALTPETRIQLIRVLHRDDSPPASLSLTGGPPARGLALMGGGADAALQFVARSLGNAVREYLKWTAAARALANRLDVAPPELTETVQGDADTRYFLGGFDLAEDEWLEVTMPEDIGGYWSLHAYNYWYEHLQTPGAHDRNARRDADGRIRIAVGPSTPDDALNRIDTLGRRRGAFVCRIIGPGGCPSAQLRKRD
ncbi:DUF1254 domain-containing protein [Phenylobacterium sp. LjRoot219]|uniref:DUF1254 domain-containing protein n=1 Tax=Phenylobacterium sp. LjRoot219 TaxID=3342283 RepID=UPI003ECD0E90